MAAKSWIQIGAGSSAAPTGGGGGGGFWVQVGSYLYPTSTAYIVITGGTSTDASLLSGSIVSLGSIVCVSAQTNATYMSLALNGTSECQLIAGKTGTASYAPMTFYTNNTLGMTLSTTGRLLIGLSTSDSSANTGSVISAASVLCVSASTNAVYIALALNGTSECEIIAGKTGTASYAPLTFYTSNIQRMVLDTSGRLNVLGYTLLGSSGTPATVLNIIGSSVETDVECRIQAYGSSIGALFTGYKANGTSSSPTDPVLNDTLISFQGLGYDSGSFHSGGFFTILAAENWTNVAQGTAMTFGTIPSGTTTRVESMRITGDRLLVGLTSSDSSANQGSVISAASVLCVSAATNAIYISLALNGTSECQLLAGKTGSASYAPMTFYTSALERMRITTGGLIYIGSSSDDGSGSLVQIHGSVQIDSGSVVLTSGNLTLTVGNITLSNGGLTLSSGNIVVTGLINCTSGYEISGTTVIDSSRNLINIGTYSASASTFTFQIDNANGFRIHDSATGFTGRMTAAQFTAQNVNGITQTTANPTSITVTGGIVTAMS